MEWNLVDGFDHAMIAVRDLSEATRKYSGLGFEVVVPGGRHPGRGTEKYAHALRMGVARAHRSAARKASRTSVAAATVIDGKNRILLLSGDGGTANEIAAPALTADAPGNSDAHSEADFHLLCVM